MLDDYKENQEIPYKILKNSVEKKKISHAYLFISNGYPKVLDFAKSFAKYLLCPNNYVNNSKCTKCNQCENIDNNVFTEVKIIEPDGLWIKKEQLMELQEEFNKKAIMSSKKVYIINHAECLNPNSANSILKFLEEPEDNIVAILIVDNKYQLLDTITSRCQIIALNKITDNEKNEYKQDAQTFIALLVSTTQEEIDLYSSSDYFDMTEAALNFINQYEKKGKDILLETTMLFHKKFTNRNEMVYAFTIFILYYKDILNMMCHHNIEIFKNKENEMSKIIEKNDSTSIIMKINKIVEAKEKVLLNANTSLLLDKLVIDMEGGI